MTTVAFIPVRGGSKSIPLKNIRGFCGKPLVYWVAKAANDAVCVDYMVVATDNTQIKSLVDSFNFSKLSVYDRNAENAQDASSTESVMLEYINGANLAVDDTFILIQATSPLTTASDIDAAMLKYRADEADSLLSCSRVKRFFWHEDGTPVNYDFRSRPRRQDFKGTLMENGALYISSVAAILNTSCRLSGKVSVYEMPEYCGVELDEPEDWFLVEHFMRRYVLKNAIGAKRDIRLFAMDVDGVLTDGGMYYSETGDELKKFNTVDGKGIELLRKAGIKTAIVTSENTALVAQRAKKLRVDFLCQGVSDKVSAIRAICRKLDISLENVAYVGDDLNDMKLLEKVGFAACPLNALQAVCDIPGILRLGYKGGDGAVRAFADVILRGME